MELLTPNERIGWAIEQARSRLGLTPQAIAEKCGLSRPGLLGWTKPVTDIGKVERGKLETFARVVHVSLHWLLSGAGGPMDTVTPSEEAVALALEIDRIRRDDPEHYETIRRVFDMARRATRRPAE